MLNQSLINKKSLSEKCLSFWNNKTLKLALKKEIINLDDIESSSTKKWHATGVSIDTRTIKKGDVFLAISGENFDGCNFAKDAEKKGAIAIISEKKINVKIPQFLVVNSLKALNSMAFFVRNNSQAKFIGVTGSLGKTFTKDTMYNAINKHYNAYKTKGNLNNHIGVPLTLVNMPPNTEYAVIEMGMSSMFEIQHLTMLVKPDIALITSIDAVHLQYFKDVEDIAKAKSEIFEGLSLNGCAIFFDNGKYRDILYNKAKKYTHNILSYGVKSENNISVLNRKNHKNFQEFEFHLSNKKYSIKMNVFGEHRIFNTLGICLCLNFLGIDIDYVKKSFNEIVIDSGHGNILNLSNKDGKKITVVDESYNSSPSSVISNLSILKSIKSKRKIIVLADMLELGKDSKNLHIALKDSIIKSQIDCAFFYGNNMSYLYMEVKKEINSFYSNNLNDIVCKILDFLENGDLIMVKGSNGMRLHKLVNKIKSIYNS